MRLQNSNEKWFCSKCTSEILPFGIKFSPTCLINTSRPLELQSFLTKIGSATDGFDDISDADNTSGINCKYYNINEFSKCNFKSKNLSFFHLNIGSLSLHYDELKLLYEQLGLNFGVIGITETKFSSNSNPPQCQLENYDMIHTPSDSEKGGALLYLSNKLQYTRRSDLDKIVYKSKELESIFAEITQPKSKNIIVGCIYRHPKMSISDFTDNFMTPLLEKTSCKNKTLILLGDFNINLLKHDDNDEVSDFFDLISCFSLLPHIIHPTRVSTTTATLIDNIFCNSADQNTTSGNIVSTISDNFPQFLIFNSLLYNKTVQNKSLVHNWKHFNEEAFLSDMSKINWNNILELDCNNVNIPFACFYNSIDCLLDKHAPLIQPNRNKKRVKSNPWITLGIITSIEKRDNLFKSFKKEKNAISRSFIENNYKKYRNMITTLCRRSKENYYSKYFKDNFSNIKKIWEGIKSIISTKSNSNHVPTCLEINNNIVTDPMCISNTFNDYFSSVADEIKKSIPKLNKHFSSFLKTPVADSIFLSATNPEEVLKCISGLNLNKILGSFQFSP